MFRFHKPKDIITLFHKANSPVSVRAVTLLKQVSANATESATEDQASDHSHQTNPHAQRKEFDLDITEQPPTTDQLYNILEYVGQSNISSVIQGASSQNDALKKFKESPATFQWPVVVDWGNGKAVAGGKESEILRMLEGLKSS